MPQRGAHQPETEPEARDSPSPFRAPPGTSPDSWGAHPGPCLSFPPRSISKTCLGDFFLKYLPSKRPLALLKNWEQAVLGTGRRGRWIIFKLYSSTPRTERDLGLLLGVWKEESHVLLN